LGSCFATSGGSTTWLKAQPETKKKKKKKKNKKKKTKKIHHIEQTKGEKENL